jgi:hypothetical protein
VVNVEFFEVFGGLDMNSSSNSCNNENWWMHFPSMCGLEVEHGIFIKFTCCGEFVITIGEF